jgi:diadenylate cyclase
MKLDKIISRGRLVDLKSGDLKGALEELLAVSVAKFPDLRSDSLLKSLLQRESTMTTYLGMGVSLPHVRVRMPRPYVLAVGRSRVGIRHDGAVAEERVHLIVMLIAGEKARDYLQVLASIARQVKEKELVDRLVGASDLDALHEQLVGGFGGIRPVQAQQNRVNRLMFREAERVARGAGCGAIMVFGDTFVGGIERGAIESKLKTILVTRNPIEPGDDERAFAETIQVRSFSKQRMAQLRSAILVALTRGVIKFTDRICCLDGMTGSNQFDTLVVVDIEREFQTLLTGQTSDLLPARRKTRGAGAGHRSGDGTAVEGREGRPVGCLFVVGDNENVAKTFVKPLVLNPFFGYKEEERNILNPFMDETVKEFSSIDGAFIIRGDGVVESAGSLIQATDSDHPLPSGLGSRHAAAAAISVRANCISIVVSSSTSQVTLFRRGVMLPLTEKRR